MEVQINHHTQFQPRLPGTCNVVQRTTAFNIQCHHLLRCRHQGPGPPDDGSATMQSVPPFFSPRYIACPFAVPLPYPFAISLCQIALCQIAIVFPSLPSGPAVGQRRRCESDSIPRERGLVDVKRRLGLPASVGKRQKEKRNRFSFSGSHDF